MTIMEMYEELGKLRLHTTMPDGSIYSTPVLHIAINRARSYIDGYENAWRSLEDDTMPLFLSDKSEIKDWAANNMNWSDISVFSEKIANPPQPDFQEGWVNGDKEVVSG